MYVKKIMLVWAAIALSFPGSASADSIVTSVTVRQIQPWNGLVEIIVGLSCESNDLAEIDCAFAATNDATRAALPVSHVWQTGCDTGSGREWRRRFVWNVVVDLGEVKIDDATLTVDAFFGVRLWRDGPYWASCNIGAKKPEECGYYFWWGDTIGYAYNGNAWVSTDGENKTWDFYYTSCPTYGLDIDQLRSLGYIDSTGTLVAQHDAATAHLGAPWRMPTKAEFEALISNCTITWTTRNGVYGGLFTGKGVYASRSVFFPAAGYGCSSDLYRRFGALGEYWSSTPDSYYPERVWGASIDSGGFSLGCGSRFYGDSVRPVR